MLKKNSSAFKVEMRKQFLETDREITKGFLIIIPIFLVFTAGREKITILLISSIIYFVIALILAFLSLLMIKEILRTSWHIGSITETEKKEIAKKINSGIDYRKAFAESNKVVLPYIQKVEMYRNLIDRFVKFTAAFFILGIILLIIALLFGI